MKIDKVTISGADDNIDPGDLLILQRKFPFVEWGILVSHKRMGEQRYPTAKWIKKLPYELSICLHLCGQVCRDFVEHASEDILYDINGEHWDRVQLNAVFNDTKSYEARLHKIVEFAERNEQKGVILPYNKANKPVLDRWLFSIGEIPENIHFLYDSSGGRGKEITKFQKPLMNYTGYAGGINDANVATICETLSEMRWPDNIWIDMESGIRTGNVFDLKKVNNVLGISQNFITQPTP